MQSVDFQKIYNFENKKLFNSELLNAEINISLEDSTEFFRILISHFSERVPKDIGTSIITTLCHILSTPEFMESFLKSSFAIRLPYHQKNLTEPLLDLFYLFASDCPSIITDAVANKFARLIPRSPRKALIVISQYSQHYDEVENPYPMLDLLINGEEYFTKEECATDLLQTLSFLCREHRVFLNGRYQDCSEIAKNCLESPNNDTIKAAYELLSTICQKKHNVVVPTASVMEHISVKDLEESVLYYLMVAPEFNCRSIKFIKRLIRISQDNVNATLVLMKLATDEDVAELLVDYSKWMAADLPTPLDTARLFLVVFQNESLRNTISRLPEFTQVLLSLIYMKNAELLGVVCTILRRVRLDEKLMRRLSEDKVISSFLRVSDELETPESLSMSILLCKTISDVCYVREFLPFCEALVEAAEENDENFLKVVSLAIDLCQYNKCLKKLRKCHMSDVLRKSRKTKKSKVRELIDILEDDDYE